MNALKRTEPRNHRRSFKQRVAAAAQATARVLHFPRRGEMATKLQTLLPRVEHTLAERMRAAGEATARILHLPRRHQCDAAPTPLTAFGGGGGGSPDDDAELLELGREFDAAVAVAAVSTVRSRSRPIETWKPKLALARMTTPQGMPIGLPAGRRPMRT